MKPITVRNYFVDEAGDPVLFGKRGRVLVGTEGCSRFFILGLLDIADREALGREMEELRQALLADPYFRAVPSMQPETRKTTLSFHAKDDLPEVRREVFSLLLRHELRFFAVVRDKRKVLDYVRTRSGRDPNYRYTPNELYDLLTRRLFRDRLHKADEHEIVFAERGKVVDRTAALAAALSAARDRFKEKWGIPTDAPIRVHCGSPKHYPGLQAVDYFLWAVQRLYEKREERFIAAIWSVVSLVQDLDDTREKPYGRYYTQEKPLSLAALKG